MLGLKREINSYAGQTVGSTLEKKTEEWGLDLGNQVKLVERRDARR